MANPFGAVVDNYKLDENPIYVGKPKTQEDRAREALNLENDEQKYTRAANYVRELQREWGSGFATHCVIYNATGDTLRLVDYGEDSGRTSRTPFPMVIGNGQWVTFLHVGVATAGLVYRGRNANGVTRDFLIAWSNTGMGNIVLPTNNSVLCSVGRVDSFRYSWDTLLRLLFLSTGSKSTINRDGARIEVDIAPYDRDPFFRAVLSIPFRSRM